MKKFRVVAMILALVLAVSCLAGCGASNEKADNGEVVLTWYFLGETNSEGRHAVYARVNEILKEKTGVTVDFQPIEPSAYEDKIKLIISGGEDYDICWASNWRNDYAQNVANGNFLAIDELLANNPALKDSIDEDIWNAVKIGGAIYGIPNQQILARGTAFYIPEQFMSVYEEKVPETVTSYADFTEYIKELGTKNPDYMEIKMNWQDLAYLYKVQPLIGTYVPGAIKLDAATNDLKVFNQFDSDEFKDALHARDEWNKQGWTMKGQATASKTNYKYDELPLLLSTYKPGGDVENSKIYGFKTVMNQASDMYLTAQGVNSSLSCVNVNSKYPEEAVKVLAEVNTNAEIMNLLTYGFEGINYEFMNEEKTIIRKITDVPENQKYGSSGWRMGNELLTYAQEGQDENVRQITKEMNDNAVPSPALGFSVDSEPIKLEINNCTSVIKEYYDTFDQGLATNVDALLAEMNKKLEDAGLQKILDELQKQLDAWKATV